MEENIGNIYQYEKVSICSNNLFMLIFGFIFVALPISESMSSLVLNICHKKIVDYVVPDSYDEMKRKDPNVSSKELTGLGLWFVESGYY